MYDSIKKKLKDNIKNICQNMTKTKHFNIVLLGREGVGKSTLLNSVLKLEGKDSAKTGVGDSITLEMKKYSNPKMHFLTLYDTQGIGIKEENSIEKIFSDVSKLINKQIIKEDANPDDLIHCLWFCFNGRFGNLEIELLKQLSETYSDKTLPFIIVHTKTFSKKEAKKSIEDIIKTYKIPEENICQVLAQDEEDEDEEENVKKSFGIDILMKKTVDKIEAAVESANYQFTRYHIFIEIDKFLDSISKGEKIEFNKEISDELSFNKLKDELAEVLFKNAKTLIQSITNSELDKKIMLYNRFQSFLFDTISKAESLFNLMMEEISKKHSPEIGNMLFDIIKKTSKGKEEGFLNEKSYMFEYQNDIKNEYYPFRKFIRKKVQEYIFNELAIRVMEYFRLAIKQSFIEYARENDSQIKNLFEEYSKESIKFASEEIVKNIELSFPSKKKK